MCQMCAMVRPAETCWFSGIGPVQATLLERQDAPNAVTGPTPYAIRPGDEFVGSLTQGDVDVVSITLTAGQTYRLFLTGGSQTPGLDTVLSLYTAGGQLLASNDDGGGGRSSLLNFTPTESGTYLLGVTGYNGAAGQYRLAASVTTPPPVGTVNDLAGFLSDGYWNGFGEARRSFDTSASNVITVNLTGLTAAGRTMAQAAMDAWEMVANVDFRVVTGAAQISFDDNQSGAFANFVLSGGRTLSASVNVSTDWLTQYGTAFGSYSLQTYIHEIGHALGLGHQGPYNGGARYSTDTRFQNDSWSLSIMSYFDQDQNPFDPASFGFLLTPMLADIVAIQNLYGAPVGGVTAGDTVWGEGSNLRNFLGDFFRAEFAKAQPMAGVALTIFDQGGRDRVVFSTDRTNQSVVLEGEARWNVYGGTGNVTVARGTVLEDYVAGSGHDTVVGNDGANQLTGNAGNDSLTGRGGSDLLDGGAGNDTLDGGAGNDVFVVSDAGDVVRELAGGGTDTVQTGLTHRLAAQVENLTLTGTAAVNGTGNELANRIVGNAAANNLAGGVGNDTLDGGAGNDTLDGGAGIDSLAGGAGNDVFVVTEAGDVMVELAGGGTDTVQTGLTHRLAAQVENLTLTGTAAVNGTGNELANRIVGNAAANNLAGGVGNDTLDGGTGNDTLDGGVGIDSLVGGAGNDVFVVTEASDVVVELAGGGTDTVQTGLTHRLAAQVENLTLTGTAAVNGTGNDLANRIVGNSAANGLIGEAGNDTLDGGAGSDTMTGGVGADVFVFAVGAGQDRVTDFVDNDDTLQIAGRLLGPGTATWAALQSVGREFADRVEFHFSATDVLTVYGVTRVAQLSDDVIFV